MNRWKWTSIAVGLLLAAMTVLPVGTSLAAEGDQPGILPGGEGLEGAGVSKVYYGAHKGNPMYTRVLSTNEEGGLLLLSEYLLGDVHGVWYGVYFKKDRSSNVWAGSDAQAWCADLYEKEFTKQEQDAVLATNKTETGTDSINGNTYEPCSINGERLYFLSAKEAINEAYGFTNNASRIAYREDTKKAYWWWLRSASSDDDDGAGVVFSNGDVVWDGVHRVEAGRPALRVNLEAVLFASPAVDGKSSGTVGAGALKAIENNGTNDWKLTLKESAAKRPFAVSNGEGKRVNAGSTLTLDYTGAVTGSNEYVSAMLMDGDGKPVYYGRMKAVTQADGEVYVTIPAGLAVGEYSLQVFNEQWNGDKETDYASEPSVIPLTVVEQENVEPPVEDSKIEGVPVNPTQGEKFTFTAQGAGMDNLNPVLDDVRWKPLRWEVNPSGDFAGEKYTQSFETAGMTPGEHMLVITFAQEWYDGSTWVATGEQTPQPFPFTLLAAPPKGGGESSVPGATPAGGTATPGDLPGSNPGTGDSGYAWYVIGLALAGGAILLLSRKKKAD